MPISTTPRFVYEDHAQLIATWENVVISVMGHSAMTVAGVRAQIAATAAHGRVCGPQRLLEVVLIDRNAPVPTADIRAILDSGVAVVGSYYLAVASIFEGSGFRAAIVRGVLTSLALLSRTEFPQQVFSSSGDCTAWCAPRLARTSTPNADELPQVIEHVRGAATERGIFLP